jgi:lipopolysaccharide/colanic/teichoic acid biosynthesis glycosyltransferase
MSKTFARWFLPRRPPVGGLGQLLSRSQLLHALDRERARSDRSGREFSLVSLSLREEHITALVRVLQDRLRLTDDKGRLAPDRVGLVLPETNAAGARVLVRDICRDFSDYGKIDAGIFIYPTDEEKGSFHIACGNEYEYEELSAANVHSMRPLLTQQIAPWTRCMDIVGAIVGLTIAAPIMAGAALLIKLNSLGPVFFAQQRTGLGGQPFTMYKMRTMQVSAESEKAGLRSFSEQDGPAFKLANDPRVTAIGRILRKTSIDELPQLWNILRGEMSLVGPRPLPCDESDACESWQKRRLDVMPGLTCIWQVEGRSLVTFDEWARMDVEYVRTRSLWTDAKLILRTIPAVLFKKGAC